METFCKGKDLDGRSQDNVFYLDNTINSQIDDSLFDAIGFFEFNENVEKMYASSIFMSSKDCGTGTCD